jgi:hypothetical protein
LRGCYNIDSDSIIDELYSTNIEGCNFNNELIFTFTLILCTFKFIFLIFWIVYLN